VIKSATFALSSTIFFSAYCYMQDAVFKGNENGLQSVGLTIEMSSYVGLTCLVVCFPFVAWAFVSRRIQFPNQIVAKWIAIELSMSLIAVNLDLLAVQLTSALTTELGLSSQGSLQLAMDLVTRRVVPRVWYHALIPLGGIIMVAAGVISAEIFGAPDNDQPENKVFENTCIIF